MTPSRLLALLLLPLSAMATESAFPPTAPGTAELKTLPAGVLLKASARGDYFEQNGRLFRPLFNYIASRDIKMTVPVEATIDGAAMAFWVGRNEQAKVTGPDRQVEVIEIPERHVASRGARGGYSRANFEKTRAELEAWLQDQPGVEATGPAYAVYWHGPYVPWFAKAYEVHIPVRNRE